MLPIAQLNRAPVQQPQTLCGELQTLSTVTVRIPGARTSNDAPAQLTEYSKGWCMMRISVPVIGLPNDISNPFAAQIAALTLVHYTCSSDTAHVILCFDKPVLQIGACNAMPAASITLELPPGYYNGAIPLQLYRNDDFARLSPEDAQRELRYSAYSNKQQLLAELEFSDAGKLVRARERSPLVAVWRRNSKDLATVTQSDAEELAARAETEILQRKRAPRVYPHELTGELYVKRGDDGAVPACVVYMLFRVVIRELYAAETHSTVVKM